MRLTILGGGGFRVPLVYAALLSDPDRTIDDVLLYDVDPARLRAITLVLKGLADWSRSESSERAEPPRVRATSDLDEALRGAEFVFSAIRVGGLAGRTVDERVALDLGVLGQETTGPGGLAYALRTLPVALDIAERTARLAPDAWFINFTNPAGIITEAMHGVLGERVIGICDSPIALARRAMRALGLDPAKTEIDYVGLNHLGWLRALHSDGADQLPRLLHDPATLLRVEEGRLFGPEWIAALGSLPNEYLYYYYFTREAIAAISGADQTRGEYLRAQQDSFYAEVAAAPTPSVAAQIWARVRAERDASYMAEARDQGEERDAEDIAGGGYEGVALTIMNAISRDRPITAILNVRNAGAIPGMPDDAVVEVPCRVDAGGPQPQSMDRPEPHQLGLMLELKAVERLVIHTARTGSKQSALAAFALHPLVDSVSTARALLAAYDLV